MQDKYSAPNNHPGWGEEHPGKVQSLTPVHLWHPGELSDVLPPVELRSAVTPQSVMQESIIPEAADTPGGPVPARPHQLGSVPITQQGHSLGHLAALAQFPKGKKKIIYLLNYDRHLLMKMICQQNQVSLNVQSVIPFKI